MNVIACMTDAGVSTVQQHISKLFVALSPPYYFLFRPFPSTLLGLATLISTVQNHFLQFLSMIYLHFNHTSNVSKKKVYTRYSCFVFLTGVKIISVYRPIHGYGYGVMIQEVDVEIYQYMRLCFVGRIIQPGEPAV